MMAVDSGIWQRFDDKLDRLSGELTTVREQLAAMAERFTPRSDTAQLSERVATLESDTRRLLAIVSAVGTVAVGSGATLIAQIFGG